MFSEPVHYLDPTKLLLVHYLTDIPQLTAAKREGSAPILSP